MRREKRTLSVAELNRYLRGLLEDDALLAGISVNGEIGNCKRHSSGHLYFDLKDDEALLHCVMFRAQAASLSFLPETGMRVLATGYVSVYERGGLYQLYVQEMHADGEGALYAAFLALKERLEAAGCFAETHKKPLPFLPACVGVVSSADGAAWQDIRRISLQRWPGAELILAPVAVQGPEAPAQIAAAIRSFNRHKAADVLIVGRGGGSAEELWAFNTEEVVRAIYDSEIPVLSAVGHETDWLLSDLAADVRAATPTAAAMLVWPERVQLLETLAAVEERLRQAARAQLLAKRMQLAAATALLPEAAARGLAEKRARLQGLAARLAAADPLAILARGYALCQNEAGETLRDAALVRPEDILTLHLAKGSFHCRRLAEEGGKADAENKESKL